MVSAALVYLTTTNDKDANTTVTAEVVCDTHTVAVDSGHGNQHWDDDSSSEAFVMRVIEHPSKDQLRYCSLRMSATARGNDRWDYGIVLVATFSDNTQREWRFEGSLNSRDSHTVSQSFPMANHHR